MSAVLPTLCFILLTLSGHAQAATDAERTALQGLYQSTGGASWTHRNGWLEAGVDPCSWYGVTCEVGTNAVIKIDLTSNNLKGQIPSGSSDQNSIVFS